MKWRMAFFILASLTYYEMAWALNSWALDCMDAKKTQKISPKNEVVVAVIDTGVDLNHKDLKNKLWTNPGEIPDNGIDDDNNGYIDDIHGWNFADQSNKITDTQGHGTHIAGIIAGEQTGLAPNVKIMVLKYYDPDSIFDVTLKNVVRAIEYATKMNARIINFSAGGKERNFEEERAIAEAGKKGILFVAAAGNDRLNSDVFGFFPADYDLRNILSVAAIGKDRNILKVSNFGRRSVDLAAPGEAIISTYPGGGYELMSGTSQATAFATAAASLLISQNGQLLPEQIIARLTSTGELNPDLLNRTRFAVQINSYRALAMKDSDETATGIKESRKLRNLFFSPYGVQSSH